MNNKGADQTADVQPGPEIIKLISYSTQLSIKFNSATTIYLSYSYNPVATNTNLRAVTLVYPCSGLNIDSNDVTDYRN